MERQRRRCPDCRMYISISLDNGSLEAELLSKILQGIPVTSAGDIDKRNALTNLRRNGLIINKGTRAQPQWVGDREAVLNKMNDEACSCKHRRSITHTTSVYYTDANDGIYVGCGCGWIRHFGFNPSVEKLVKVVESHTRVVNKEI